MLAESGRARSIPDLTIRPAHAEDAHLLWIWANDPEARAHAFSPEPISWETHERWYSRRLLEPGTRIWILEAGGNPAGQIRYDRSADLSSAEISYSVSAEHRGRRYGSELLRRTRELAGAELMVREIFGLVLLDNIASYRSFLRAGFADPIVVTHRGKRCYRFTWRPITDGGAGGE